MTKSVALYARVSSERQAQQGTIDSQLTALRERAAQDGCIVLPSDEHVDNGRYSRGRSRGAPETREPRVWLSS
jgi:site-specific DNA recombinase